MRYLPPIIALVAFMSVTISAPEEHELRDGVWIQNGIRQYERLKAHESLSERETDDAKLVSSYVCAVVDLEDYLVQRANLLAAALEEARTKHQLDPQVIKGITEASAILVPLMKTHFSSDSPSCEAAMVTVGNYLEK